MANTLALSNIRTQSVGARTQGIATLTLTGDGSNYADDGIAMPTGWKSALGLHVGIVDHIPPVVLRATTTTNREALYLGIIDDVAGKVVLASMDTSGAGANQILVELGAVAIPAGTYAGKIVAQGV